MVSLVMLFVLNRQITPHGAPPLRPQHVVEVRGARPIRP